MLRYFLIVISLIGFTACGSYQSATQTESNSFIQLTGAFLNSELVIDNQPTIIVDKNVKTFKLEGKQVAKFAVAPGSHTVKVLKDGQTVIHRKVFVSEGNVAEVIVP